MLEWIESLGELKLRKSISVYCNSKHCLLSLLTGKQMYFKAVQECFQPWYQPFNILNKQGLYFSDFRIHFFEFFKRTFLKYIKEKFTGKKIGSWISSLQVFVFYSVRELQIQISSATRRQNLIFSGSKGVALPQNPYNIGRVFNSFGRSNHLCL